MSEFAPPTGPPPPRIPEGWKAVWNDHYKEWFYVNLCTKQSTWEKPTSPATQLSGDAPPPGGPPSQGPGPNASYNTGGDMRKPLNSDNTYAQNTAQSDEAVARPMQEQENVRSFGPGVGAPRGAAEDYYNNNNNNNYNNGLGPGQGYQQQPGIQGGYPSRPSPSPGPPQYSQPQNGMEADRGSKSGGFLGKLKDKFGGAPGGQQPMGFDGQQPGYGGHPPQQGPAGGGYPQPAYGQPVVMQQQQKKKGLGAGGAAVLGVGGGLLGGMLLANAFDGVREQAYEDGLQAGMDEGDSDGDF